MACGRPHKKKAPKKKNTPKKKPKKPKGGTVYV
jgi:hypothetical protein